MRILGLSEHYKESQGGTSCYVRNICREFAKKGHEVFLISEPDVNESFSSKTWQQTDGYWRRNIIPDKGFYSQTRVGRKLLAWSVKDQIKRIIDDLRPDVIHIMYGMMIANLLSSLPKASTRLWTINNIPPQEYAFCHFQSIPLLHNIMESGYFALAHWYHTKNIKKKNYDRVIYISNRTRDSAVMAGIPEKNGVVIPMGIDPDVFSPMTQTDRHDAANAFPLILSVAGIISHKGQLNIIEAMPAILAEFPRAHYINLGKIRDVQYSRKIQSRIRELNLESHASLLGHVPFADLLRYYRTCDVYVQPSYQEGFCISLLQAISCGKPVIGTLAGAIPELIQGASAGLLIQHNNPKEIASSVIELIHHPINISPQGQHIYVAMNYWSAIAQRTIALYQEIMSSK